MKKTIASSICILLLIATFFASCGSKIDLNGRIYECDMAGQSVFDLVFSEDEVMRISFLNDEETNGTYKIKDNKINIEWEDGYSDVLTYDMETDTLSLGGDAIVWVRLK